MMNRFFTLLFAASCLTAVGQVPDYVPTDGLVAWYGMDGDTEDELGEFNGVPSGLEQSIDRFGNAASCFHFSGGNSHIDLGDDGALVPATALTFAVWMKPIWNAAFSNNTIVGRNTNSSSNYGVNWGIYGSPNDRILRFGIGDAQNFGVVDDMDVPYPIEEEVWVHYAVTYDASNDSVKFFIDGQVVAVELTEVDEINDNDQNTFIGKYRASGGGCTCQWFTGDLDELGIWNRTLSSEELWFLYQLSKPIEGCTDFNACNYNAEANLDNGSCLSCDLFAERCLEGTIWSEELGGCVVANPSDSNFDGCVQLNDLLDLLSAYGDCGAEESAWQCGDPLDYQGYEYATVQIGEQCWFAENLRSENYDNGDVILSDLNFQEWATTTEGAVAIYGTSADCENYAPNFNACDSTQSLSEYGRLYNWYAVQDDRGLCPIGWHVPSDQDWITMEIVLGMTVEEANATGIRGINEGAKLKESFGWYDGGDGVNSSGFSGLPAGTRTTGGNSNFAGQGGYWWSSSPKIGSPSAWFRALAYAHNEVLRSHILLTAGHSVRCIKDTE